MAGAVASGGNGKRCFRDTNVLSLDFWRAGDSAKGLLQYIWGALAIVGDGVELLFFRNATPRLRYVALQMSADHGLWVSLGTFSALVRELLSLAQRK
jgi:hypothetical protein